MHLNINFKAVRSMKFRFEVLFWRYLFKTATNIDINPRAFSSMHHHDMEPFSSFPFLHPNEIFFKGLPISKLENHNNETEHSCV